MAYTRITAAEAASMIQNDDTVAFSGFTPSGTAKAVSKELAVKARREHEAGREFKVSVLTGASTGHSTDGDLSEAQAIKYRAPYTTDADFRRRVNLGEIPYSDIHLSQMAQQMRYGFFGEIDWAIIEVCEIEEGDTTCRAWLTAGTGISPTAARLARHVILELNSFHSSEVKHLHDVYELQDPPYRQPIPLVHVHDRIGRNYIEIDPAKIVGVVECNLPDEARGFKGVDDITTRIGQNVASFLLNDMRRGIIPPDFLPLQSGVGSTANAILAALTKHEEIPAFNLFTEVYQDAIVELMMEGRVKDASACSLTVTNESLSKIYSNIDFFKQHITLRPSEISNNPELIRRLGVIAINTALECDIYGNANSTHVCGTKIMNGIGGAGDFIRNAYISIFTCPSTAKNGLISSIVPMVSHHDHTEHDVDVIVTEQGVADLRSLCPLDRAKAIIDNCAHPDYRPMLRDYLRIGTGGHTRHCLKAAFAMHDAFIEKGDMHLTDFSVYAK